MNHVIFTARVLFIGVALLLILAAGYVIVRREDVSGPNALTVLLSAAAAIGAIAQWQLKEK
jgi:hypothetical protein